MGHTHGIPVVPTMPDRDVETAKNSSGISCWICLLLDKSRLQLHWRWVVGRVAANRVFKAVHNRGEKTRRKVYRLHAKAMACPRRFVRVMFSLAVNPQDVEWRWPLGQLTE
jgi:hypothetical protein